MVYTSEDTDVKDLHCERIQPGIIASTWWLTPEERECIAAGANVMLFISTEPIPPVSLGLTFQQGIGEDAPEILERLEALIDEQR